MLLVSFFIIYTTIGLITSFRSFYYKNASKKFIKINYFLLKKDLKKILIFLIKDLIDKFQKIDYKSIVERKK